jgi:hypothetical protein
MPGELRSHARRRRVLPRRLQRRDDFAPVLYATRLEHELDLGLARGRARECALVVYLDHVGAGSPDHRARLGECARHVAHAHHHPREAPAAQQRSLDRVREREHVDVAARENHAHALARKPGRMCEQRRERGGARPLGHRLLHLEQQQDRGFERLLVGEQDLAHVLAEDREREPAWLVHGDVARDRRIPARAGLARERLLHRWEVRRLHGLDLELRAQLVSAERHAREQPPRRRRAPPAPRDREPLRASRARACPGPAITCGSL